MDCRKSFLLGLCLLGAGAGCLTQPTVPGGAAANLKGADSRLAREHGKIKPNAETCVAYGKWMESKAGQPGLSPQEQQALRDEARKSYQRAIDLEPSSNKGYVALCEYFMATEDLGRALETCRKGLKRLPKESALWSEQGFCHCRKKDWSAAVESFRKACELDPENREHGTELGLCLARAGRIEESVACLTKVQGAAQAHYNVARMLERLNQPEQSKQHLSLALQLKPDLEPAQQMLARLEGAEPAGDNGVAQVGFSQPTP
jgi:tetratricopeptide (TPR) repeat protein